MILGEIGLGATGAVGAIALLLLTSLPSPPPPSPLRPRAVCPDTIEALLPLLLRDLPSYANRVLTRSQSQALPSLPPSYVLIAGKPELDPLTLGPGVYQPTTPDPTVQQVFFTTLERQYSSDWAIRLQSYHWGFLAQTQHGWRLVLLFSRFGGTASDHLPSPPQNTSQGAIAQAIRLWLRDCEAGAIVAN